jgi:hypothetical protein
VCERLGPNEGDFACFGIPGPCPLPGGAVGRCCNAVCIDPTVNCCTDAECRPPCSSCDPLTRTCVSVCDECEECDAAGNCRPVPDLRRCGVDAERVCCDGVCQPPGVDGCCTSDAECDDGLLCTRDTCAAVGICVHDPIVCAQCFSCKEGGTAICTPDPGAGCVLGGVTGACNEDGNCVV